nr:glycosyltransferase family 4 protein [Rhodoblastus sphagnicola]
MRGGAVERIWHSLCVEFARMGHDVTMISRRFSELPNDEIREGIHYIRVPSNDAPKSKLLYRFFDVIYGIKVCAALPSSDITITNSVSLPFFIPRARAGAIYVSVGRFPKGYMHLYARADRLQAVSQAIADAMRTQSPSVAARVKVLPNALSPKFTRLRRLSRGQRKKEIIFVGRIAREKGLHLLIRAFLKINGHADWRVTLLGPSAVGDGGDGSNYFAELKALIGENRARIKIEPAIFDETTLVERLQVAEIFVYPSMAERGESFGMAPLEAMACGCAVVVSSLPCFKEFVVADHNALVFDHRLDAETELACKLERLMSSNTLRDELGLAAINTSRYFDVDRIAKLFVADFAKVISK